jgi:2-oxoglutarate ferredoxin oxidoreductase subunit beta
MEFELTQKPVNKDHKSDNSKNHFAAFCPGCSNHAIVHTVRDVLTDLVDFRPILYSPVGCTVKLYEYFDDDKFDNIQVPHGRGPAAAAASRKACPGRPVIVVQGDGDALTIGGNELLHAIERGDKITIIILNNGLFGMTGGQISSSTPAGSFTSTTIEGRNPERVGYPLDLYQLASHPGVSYFRRLLMNDKGEIEEFGKCLANAVAHQMKGMGLSIIEILCSCPSRQKLETDEKMSKVKAARIYSEEILAGAFPTDRKTGADFNEPLMEIKKACQNINEMNGNNREDLLNGCLKFFKNKYALDPTSVELVNKEFNVVLSGRGGQGIQTIAELLYRIWTPVFPGSTMMPWYTPEVRNATTSAILKISREQGINPDAQNCEIDALLCMSQDGLEKYIKRLSPEHGLLIYDPEGCSFDLKTGDLPGDVSVYNLPAAAISRKEFGNPLYGNMILAGFLSRKLSIFAEEGGIPANLDNLFNGIPTNFKAFLTGYNHN